jgi:RNA polymerase primary sigma factor
MRQIKISQKITNRDAKSIEKYFLEIDRFSPLSSADEADCARRIKKGDINALNKLINGNLRFVVSVAKQYQNSNSALGDLISVGNEGLIRAAKTFDETKGFKFISYAVWSIRQSIIKYMQENSRMVRLPISKSTKLNHYKKFENHFLQNHHEKPSIEDIAENLKVTIEEARGIVDLSELVVCSLDKPLDRDSDGDGEATLSNFLIDEEAELGITRTMTNQSLNTDLMRGIETLKEKEQFVIIKLFNIDNGGEQSMESIAGVLQTTKERVRQLKESALKKLRINKINKKLVQYL